MRSTSSIFAILLMIPVPAGTSRLVAQDAALPTIYISTERVDAVYRTGETVVFQIEVRHPSGRILDVGSLDYHLSEDGHTTIESESLALTGKPIEVSGKLDRPGFLRCEVTFQENPEVKPARSAAAAGISPEEILPSREMPPDFDAFWSEQMERLATLPLESKMTRRLDENSSIPLDIEFWDAQVNCEGPPVSGYFARPKNARPRSLPAVLWTHGAGVRSASVAQTIKGAREGFLSFDINAHGIPNGEPEAFYRELHLVGPLKDYPYQGRENRDGMYFRGMFLRLVRAIDFLTEQPEWDGRNVAVIGHSQGGAQAIAAGSLDRRVTFIGAGVPAMCDHTGMIRRRISGWPKLVPILPGGRPDPNIAEVSRYFDAVNFASRCHAEAIVSVGFIDRVCPPTSCYAAFNQLKGKKQVLNEPAMGHAAPLHIRSAFFDAWKAHLAEQEKQDGD